jgi:Fe-S cluster assembly ATP-binding protein
MLDIENLHVRIAGKTIIDGLNLKVDAGQVAAIMGPNGSGKSTLSYVIAGRADYEVTEGSIKLDGVDLLDKTPAERAALGTFLSFQYPLEIPGVATMTFLKAALNAQRRARLEAEMSTPDFMRRVREAAARLNISQDMLKRAVNLGFSGGEKKRMEILQMALLEPRFAILDEMDSGLDIDALRVCADGVNALRSPERGLLVITHYQRLLDYIAPSGAAVRNWRWSWRRAAMPITPARRRDDHSHKNPHRSGGRFRPLLCAGGVWRHPTRRLRAFRAGWPSHAPRRILAL